MALYLYHILHSCIRGVALSLYHILHSCIKGVAFLDDVIMCLFASVVCCDENAPRLCTLLRACYIQCICVCVMSFIRCIYVCVMSFIRCIYVCVMSFIRCMCVCDVFY